MERRIPRPTRLTPKVIALEYAFPVAGEVIPGVPAHPITFRAEARDSGDAFAANAKERLLAGTRLYPGPQEVFRSAGEG
jgi:hypothetical protein